MGNFYIFSSRIQYITKPERIYFVEKSTGFDIKSVLFSGFHVHNRCRKF